ncbi:uncharacterized protein LOC144111119 [Amblyomma americanum]
MGRRPLKYKTARAYGTCKRKSPMVKKKKSSASITSDVQRTDEVTGSQASTSCAATTVGGAAPEPLPSTSHADETSCANTGDSSELSTSRSASPEASSDEGTARVAGSLGTSRDDATPCTSTGRTIQAHLEPRFVSETSSDEGTAHVAGPLGTSHDDATPSTSTRRTIQAHLEPRFVSPEASQEAAAKVQAKLSAVPATARKMELTGGGEALATTEQTDEFVVVQVTALSALLENAKCQQCSQPGLSVQLGTRFGLAAQLELTCALCGTVAKEWSSPRKEGRRIFYVNLRAIQAVKSIGKGATALNDFWSIMNVSQRGLYHKTFQKHLKSEFRLASETAAAKNFSDAVAAVRTVYSEMDPTFNNNITVVYDGTWLTRGHTSHIGVGTVIGFYTGLVLDCVVLSNRCHGCTMGPKEGNDGYQEWKASHICQKKNTDVKSGRMEVEASLILFRRSLQKHGLRYTNIVCDGDSRTFLALCEDKTYGFIPFTKEDCVNHVKKRMGTALRALVTKSKKGRPIGGKGGLTQALIKKLTNYYGKALHDHDNVEDMQKAVMATFYHVTSTDERPRHKLCPQGPQSWCQHQAAEAEGKPLPSHKYQLARHVTDALLPVYRRLSDVQLLSRCLGKKTQNAAESFIQ